MHIKSSAWIQIKSNVYLSANHTPIIFYQTKLQCLYIHYHGLFLPNTLLEVVDHSYDTFLSHKFYNLQNFQLNIVWNKLQNNPFLKKCQEKFIYIIFLKLLTSIFSMILIIYYSFLVQVILKSELFIYPIKNRFFSSIRNYFFKTIDIFSSLFIQMITVMRKANP